MLGLQGHGCKYQKWGRCLGDRWEAPSGLAFLLWTGVVGKCVLRRVPLPGRGGGSLVKYYRRKGEPAGRLLC